VRPTRAAPRARAHALAPGFALFLFAPSFPSLRDAAEAELLRFTLDALLPEERAALLGGDAERFEDAHDHGAADANADVAELMAEAEDDAEAEASYEEARLSYEETRFTQYAQAAAAPTALEAATPPASPLRAAAAPPGTPLSPLTGVAVAAVLDELLADASGDEHGRHPEIIDDDDEGSRVQRQAEAARFASPPRRAAAASPLPPMSPV
jgi:hypothetical protein